MTRDGARHHAYAIQPVLGPRFLAVVRRPFSDEHLRVSDAERQAVTDRLAEHFGDGRLDQAEFDERVGGP